MPDDYNLLRTTDYDSLKMDHKNRPINSGHVSKLMKSIAERNLLHLRPGSVGKDNIIIDGQHRFVAAKKLSLPYWYIKDNTVSIDDAPILNMHQMNWSLPQWEHYWIESEKQDYRVLRTFRKQYNFPISTSIELLYNRNAHVSGRHLEVFKAGEFKARHIDFAEDVGAMINDIFSYADHSKTQTFILAFLDAIKSGEYDHERFMKKLMQVPYKLHRRATRKDNLRNIEEVYNYQESDRVRFF